MFDTPPRYRSYLLTAWEERGRDPNLPAVWRFSLEDPHTRRRRGFADLEALVAALKGDISGAEATEREPQKGPTCQTGSSFPDTGTGAEEALG